MAQQAPEPRYDRGGLALGENEVLNEDGSVTVTREDGTLLTHSARVRAFLGQVGQQGRLEPGQQGWWPVWGPRWLDVQQGDYLITVGRRDDGTHRAEGWRIAALEPFEDRMKDAIWLGIRTPDGQHHGLGRGQNIVLYRWMTKNKLSDHI